MSSTGTALVREAKCLEKAFCVVCGLVFDPRTLDRVGTVSALLTDNIVWAGAQHEFPPLPTGPPGGEWRGRQRKPGGFDRQLALAGGHAPKVCDVPGPSGERDRKNLPGLAGALARRRAMLRALPPRDWVPVGEPAFPSLTRKHSG